MRLDIMTGRYLDHFQMVSAVAWTPMSGKILCLLLPIAADDF